MDVLQKEICRRVDTEGLSATVFMNLSMVCPCGVCYKTLLFLIEMEKHIL